MCFIFCKHFSFQGSEPWKELSFQTVSYSMGFMAKEILLAVISRLLRIVEWLFDMTLVVIVANQGLILAS